jgi:DNA repair exonuclease SbcCD ATPase subunit/DNA repair exonuclease SbcCD nuclease subunit
MVNHIIEKKNKIKNIIHFSDIHIRTGNSVQSRYEEYLYVFDNLILKLKNLENIKESIIIITGDIFHHKNQIESSGIDLFSYIIKELTELTEVFIIMGNHDYRQDNSEDKDLISALVKNSNYKNLYYLEKSGIYIINNVLIGLQAINDVLQDGDTSGMVENLPDFPNPNECDLTNIDYKIALYHGIIVDDNNSFFKEKNKGIHVNWFKDYDMALLGDNHKQQINNIKNTTVINNVYDISDKHNNNYPIWGYAGSLIQQNFGESINNHGYLRWDLENKKVETVNIKNKTAYCTFNSNNTKKNNDKDWFKSLEEFKVFIDDNNLQSINIRFLTNEKILNVSDVIELLDNNGIEYNKFCYNENLLNNNSNFKNSENIRSINNISSYNLPNKWYEYIETNGNKDIIGNYDWKNMLNNPETLQIDENKVPEILKVKVDDRNKKLLNYITKYIDSIDTNENKNNNLKLLYMEWSWILCYQENCWFNFENMDNNVGLLNANNGYGKSSFLEIICLALFGEAMPSRHNKNLSASIICQQKPKTSASRVKLVILLDNKKYMITRKFNYQKNMSKLQMQNELHYLNENNLVKLKSGNAVKEWVTINIGNINTFLISSMLTQNSDKDFFSMKYSEQINLLDKALSLESINILVELLKQARLLHSNIVDALEVQYLQINSEEIDNITEEEVTEYSNLVEDTKKQIKILQDTSYTKLTEINNKVTIKDEKDFNKTDKELKKLIKDIKITNSVEDITKIHNQIGQLTIKKNTSESKFKDLKIKYNSNTKNDSNRFYSSRSILWKFIHVFTGQDCEKDYVLTKLDLERIEKEYKACEQYFDSNNNILSIEDLEKNIYNLEKEQIEKTDKENKILNELDKLLNVNNIYINNINSNLKDQKALSKKIKTTIEDCQKSLDDYDKMSEKIIKKKKLLENNEKALELLDKNIIEYNKLDKQILELNKSIEDILSKEYPFNPDCECCKAQPWKLLLSDLQKKLDSSSNELEIINKVFKEYNTTSEDYIDNKKQQLIKNINKFKKYIELYNELKKNKGFYENQIDLIKDYNEYETKLTKFERLQDENNKILKKLEKDKKTVQTQINKLNSKIEDTKADIKLKKEYDEWILRKNKNEKDIEKYLNYCDKIVNEYHNDVKLLNELNIIVDDYNKNKENIKLKEYWENINLTKPLWNEYIEIKKEIDKKNNYLTVISNKYINLKKDYITNQKTQKQKEDIKIVIDDFSNTINILNHFSDIFGNFRNWLYKNKIIPLIVSNTNEIIDKVSVNNTKLMIDTVWNLNDTFYWTINDGNNNPNIEKASGFQRFIAGLAIKITLSNIGISNLQCSQLFIDEGFTSCDRGHLSKIPVFINSLLNLYDSVLVVSHLQEIKDSVSITMNIDRNVEKSLSLIRYGTQYNITQNKIEGL